MADDCLFCKILAGEVPAQKAYEDDLAIAFSDINPQAPHHLLIIPKKHIASINELEEGDEAIVGHLFTVAKKITAELGEAEPGYRVVVNTNARAGQTVFHIHMHLLAGRALGWPPG